MSLDRALGTGRIGLRSGATAMSAAALASASVIGLGRFLAPEPPACHRAG
jgi:hypothetical protein